jgi:hypothetical protein
MKPNLGSIRFSLAILAALVVSAIFSQAQAGNISFNVNVIGTLTDVAGGGGVYDYTLTLSNAGPESVESLWFGWTNGGFNVATPTNPGNLQGWSNVPDGNSIQYGGTSGTAIPSGGNGTFTFDSTSTPAQFQAGSAGPSVAYGVNAQQFGFFNTTMDSREFTPTVVPEPSTLGLVAIGSLGFLGAVRRKLRR